MCCWAWSRPSGPASSVDEQVMSSAARLPARAALQPAEGLRATFWQANRQAFILYVLAEAGAGDLGRSGGAVRAARHAGYLRQGLPGDGAGPAGARRATRASTTLLSDITSAAIVSATGAHWEEAQVDYYAMNTDTRSTAIVLAALARLDQRMRWRPTPCAG